jgi:hypothetical protein
MDLGLEEAVTKPVVVLALASVSSVSGDAVRLGDKLAEI